MSRLQKVGVFSYVIADWGMNIHFFHKYLLWAKCVLLLDHTEYQSLPSRSF